MQQGLVRCEEIVYPNDYWVNIVDGEFVEEKPELKVFYRINKTESEGEFIDVKMESNDASKKENIKNKKTNKKTDKMGIGLIGIGLALLALAVAMILI